MAFVSGPRQVGKTTSCRHFRADHSYLTWDDQDDRRLILSGPRAVVESLHLERLGTGRKMLVLDEFHKYSRWKTFLKGLFDKEKERIQIVVTGSSRMEHYQRGGDSLMGRYLPYRMHPLSVGELISTELLETELRLPPPRDPGLIDALWTHGGFPEPLALANPRFSRRWRRLRRDQLIAEDIRDLSQIRQVDQLSVLADILGERSASQLSYAHLARQINVAVDTARRWVGSLVALHHGFLLRPFSKNVAKSLRKEPKWYLRDWSTIDDVGQRAETFVAAHLLKAVQTWEDLGLGDYELNYLRDKAKREVDFVVVRDGRPWFLVEVKHSDTTLSPALRYFQDQIGAVHAFQGVFALPWTSTDCFSRGDPCVVPIATLLSQLP
ncbi:MAG: ATP-binding protein [Deltaproteobacteria bacterium]|nr:ATP-binding protein [Deltaproteobacteria bacterium]